MGIVKMITQREIALIFFIKFSQLIENVAEKD